MKSREPGANAAGALNLDDLIQVQGVVVATPTATHFEIISAVLEMNGLGFH